VPGDRLNDHGPELFVRASPGFHLFTERHQDRKRGCGIFPCKQHPCPGEGQFNPLSELSRRLDFALSKQDGDLRRRDLRQPRLKATLVRRSLSLLQNCRRAILISLGQLDAGKQNFAANEPVDGGVVLQRKLMTLLSVLPGSIQLVPFVEDAAQAGILFARIGRPQVTKQLQGALIDGGCLVEPVFAFLHLRQAC
jgi:hypothetical protein